MNHTVNPNGSGSVPQNAEKHVFKYFIIVAFGLLLIGLSYFSNLIILAVLAYFCLLSLRYFAFALFVLGGIAIAQHQLAVIFRTSANVYIDEIYFLELYFPFFAISFLFNLIVKQRSEEIWKKSIRENLIIFFFLVIWSLLCISFSDWKLRAFFQFGHTFVFYLYLIILSTLTSRDLRYFLKVIAFWGVVFFIMALLNVSDVALKFESVSIGKMALVHLNFFDSLKRAHVMSTTDITAVTMGFYAWCAYALGFVYRKRKYKLFLMATLIAIGLVFTRTRSEMVGFFCGGIVVTLLLSWERKFFIRGLTIWFTYFIFIYLAAHGSNIIGGLQRLKTSADTSEKASLGIRMELWKKGVKGLVESKGMGKGTGGYTEYRDQWPHAHNVYFSILFDLGIVGFILWLIVYLNLWRHIIYCLKRVPPFSENWVILVFFVGFFVELSLSSLLQNDYTTFIWWLFPGLLLAAINNAMKAHPG